MGVKERKPQITDWVGACVALFIMAMAAFTTFTVMWYPVPEENQQLIGQIQGALWLAVGGIINYFFGSSKSSRHKDDTIDTLANTAQGMMPQDEDRVHLEPGEHITVEGASKHDT